MFPSIYVILYEVRSTDGCFIKGWIRYELMKILIRKYRSLKALNDPQKLQSKYGSDMVDSINLRLAQIAAANTLEDLRAVHPRTHELHGNLKGIISVDLIQPMRMLLRPDHDPSVFTRDDGGMDWISITSIIVWDIINQH